MRGKIDNINSSQFTQQRKIERGKKVEIHHKSMCVHTYELVKGKKNDRIIQKRALLTIQFE